MVTRNDIFKMLESSGIKRNDKITVHTSLKAIGEIENGADGLIDGLKEYLSDGILLIPTHTWDEVYGDGAVYDVRKSVPCIGTLPKVAAFREDGIRSLHPTHSVTAFGKRAAEYIAGDEKCTTPAPVTSALSRLYEENGKVLLLGVNHSSNTYLHAVDERLNIPNRINKKSYDITIYDYDGNKIYIPEFHSHYTEGADCCCSEYYPNYTKLFEVTGAVTYTSLGNAKVFVCDARKMTDVLREVWKKSDHDLCIKSASVPEEYYN